MTGTVLILGASGRFGTNAAEAFAASGWTVRRYSRGGGSLEAAAMGADVIVNGWNPPYPDWAAQVPGLTAQVIAAARASGATVLIPGNVYVYGAGSPPMLGPDTPHAARNPLGRIRREMEAAYRDAGVPTILLRAGDFLDTGASGNWFDQIMVKGLDKGVFTYPGRPDIDHAWAFLPDMARAAVALCEMRGELARFQEVLFPGYTLSGDEMRAALEKVTGRAVRLKRMSWLPLQIARPVWRMARGLIEMRYLWDMPHRLDGRGFAALLPGFRATPPEAALAQAVAHEVQPDERVARQGTVAA